MPDAKNAAGDRPGVSSSSVFHFPRLRFRRLERLPEIENHADADARIGDVERRVDVATKVQVDEINHMAVQQAVDEVADNAAAEQAERDLREPLLQAE